MYIYIHVIFKLFIWLFIYLFIYLFFLFIYLFNQWRIIHHNDPIKISLTVAFFKTPLKALEWSPEKGRH